jgi:hypothetical protein
VSEEVCALVRFELLQGIDGGSFDCVKGARQTSAKVARVVDAAGNGNSQRLHEFSTGQRAQGQSAVAHQAPAK